MGAGQADHEPVSELGRSPVTIQDLAVKFHVVSAGLQEPDFQPGAAGLRSAVGHHGAHGCGCTGGVWVGLQLGTGGGVGGRWRNQ